MDKLTSRLLKLKYKVKDSFRGEQATVVVTQVSKNMICCTVNNEHRLVLKSNHTIWYWNPKIGIEYKSLCLNKIIKYIKAK